MCNVYGKVMNANDLKYDISLKHRNVNSTLHDRECHLKCGELIYEAQHNDEPLAEGCKVEELYNSLVTYAANLVS